MKKDLLSLIAADRQRQWMRLKHPTDECTKVAAVSGSRMQVRRDHVFAIDTGKVRNNFFSVSSTNHKPGVALVRNAAIGGDGESALKQRVFDAVKFSKFLLRPITAGGLTQKS